MLCKSATLPWSIDLKPPNVGKDANIKNKMFTHIFIALLMLREMPKRSI